MLVFILCSEPPETKSVDQPKGQGSQASGAKDPESHVEATSGASVAAQPLQNVSGKDEETRKSEMIAELEKRKARAQRWGMPLDDIDAQIQRINRFGIPSGSEDSLKVLDSGLVGKKGGRGNPNTPKDGKPNAVCDSFYERPHRLLTFYFQSPPLSIKRTMDRLRVRHRHFLLTP